MLDRIPRRARGDPERRDQRLVDAAARVESICGAKIGRGRQGARSRHAVDLSGVEAERIEHVLDVGYLRMLRGRTVRRGRPAFNSWPDFALDRLAFDVAARGWRGLEQRVKEANGVLDVLGGGRPRTERDGGADNRE